MDEATQNNPRWGSKNRKKKALAILQTMTHFTDLSLEETKWLDIGCGSGGIASNIAPRVQFILGVDPESWPSWSELQINHENLKLVKESIETISCTDKSYDVIVCNQVYEHVPDPQYLVAEIYRILKPGGYCYFAGPNLLFPIEPHVYWPVVHWLPRKLAIKLMKLFGSKGDLDAYSVDFWTLKKWFNGFQVSNVVPYIIKNPEKYSRSGYFWKFLSCLPYPLLKMMTWISPGFVFILKKPGS